ncbi:BldC family transcriptional regulator [Kineococcus sp. T13]|uniref:BldC family transcriptional regulator n=1 Tax=Kineococcus vitellinus TaxID=2696565 RepID=UPI001412B2F1|nr:BldC family transcriptional regulator [Kineococcus vitellinus]NAZ73905.1 BldC family transcriptional regulator [Kineococcus vitellinus]
MDETSPITQDELMMPGEVAELFHVSPKTVSRWSRSGLLSAKKTLGGHRRFSRAEVEALRVKMTGEARP